MTRKKVSLGKEFTKGWLSRIGLTSCSGNLPDFGGHHVGQQRLGHGPGDLCPYRLEPGYFSPAQSHSRKVRIPAYHDYRRLRNHCPTADAGLSARAERITGHLYSLITVNCIILARAEMFASKNSALPSIIDGLGMGIGLLPLCS